MDNETTNPNIEWKKKSFGKKERLSRHLDAQQNVYAQIKAKESSAKSSSVASQINAPFSSHLKKMRKKIKEALDDEDEDEEEYSFVFDNSLLFLDNTKASDTSLFQGLNEKEKQIINQKQTSQNIQNQQNTSKLFALSRINRLAQKAGLGNLSPQDIAENMQNNGWGKETFEMAIKHNVAPDIKIGFAKLDDQKIKDLMRGIKRLQRIGGFSAVQGMKINDVINITNTKNDDQKVAQLLLKKTGRKPNSHHRKKRHRVSEPKVSFKKLLQRRQEQNIRTV